MKKPTTPTVKDIIQEVRRLAKESPDNKYENIDGCFYSQGMCTNGSIGCMFGQAFKNLGIKIPDNLDRSGIVGVLSELKLSEFNDHSMWCLDVQKLQDTRTTWGEAVSTADQEWKNV